MRDFQDRLELVLKAVAVAALVCFVYLFLAWLYQLKLIPFVEVSEPCLTGDCVSSPIE